MPSFIWCYGYPIFANKNFDTTFNSYLSIDLLFTTQFLKALHEGDICSGKENDQKLVVI